MTDRPATILLDLDDTLLRNDMDAFLPAYFQAIRAWLAGVFPTGDFMDAFLEASRIMLANDRLDRTLADAFYGHFLSRVGSTLAELEPAIDRFYREAYPALRSLTEPAPGAFETVETLREQGHTLVIATNPLFPAAAIHQRVDWAGLSLETRDFALVTSFERFHFAKPDPAYFAEIMAHLAWPDGPVVMVGNEAVNDISGARDLGLATYHVVAEGGRQAGPGRHGSGPLSGFPAWLAAREPSDLEPDYRSIDGAQAVLKSTAAALHSLARETEPGDWRIRQGEEWTPLETLSHLKDVEVEVNRKRAEIFLSSEAPFIAGIDTDRWYADGFGKLPPLSEILDGFLAERQTTLDILAEIPRAAWELPARHSILGPTDLVEITRIMAGHDRTHLQQIIRTLKPGTSGG